jgi:uncharacterized membrane protein YjjP (DUF1212 family)
MQGEWITMSTVGTFSGAVFAVTLIVQFFKGALDQYVRMPTRLLALILSWAVLLGHRYVTKGAIPFEGIYLDVLNGFLVALAAMGTHAVAKDTLKWQ